MALSVKASKQGLDILDQARRKRGWNKDSGIWLDAAGGISRATLQRFWRSEPIRRENFEAICKAVGVDEWEQIVDKSPQQSTEKFVDFFSYDEAWVGRVQLVTELISMLQGSYRLLLISGISGIGKTALAERLAEKMEDWLEGDWNNRLLRANFDYEDKPTDFTSNAARWLEELGETVSQEDHKPELLLQRLVKYLRCNQILLLIDSLEKLLDGNEEDGWGDFKDKWWEKFFLSLLSAESCQSRLIITSQSFKVKKYPYYRYRNFWYHQFLSGLNECEQKKLAKKFFEKIHLDLNSTPCDDVERLLQIGEACDGHPFAFRLILEEIIDFFNGNVQEYWKVYGNQIERLKAQVAKVREQLQLGMNDSYHRHRINLNLGKIFLDFIKNLIETRNGRRRNGVLQEQDLKNSDLMALKNTIQEENVQGVSMTVPQLNEIYNRDVFLLIDQSGSMCKQDAADSDLSRWESLQEMVMSHVDRILRGKISDFVSIFLFSRNKLKDETFKVKSASEVEDIFNEHRPDQATFIVPTLKYCLDKCFDKEQPKPRTAFLIVYTDGQFNDTEDFEELIKSTCKKLDDQRRIKILIIGVGSEIKNKINRDYFDKLNKNVKGNKDNSGQSCDIVGFAIADEMGDIIEVLEDELKQNMTLVDTPSNPNSKTN
jgi:DNA-binding Xre family transcriptional regulator